MDQRLLEAFVGVVRSGSFARYARQQALAASSVSRSIAALEHELGVRLFQRTTRKLSPTDAGQRLFLHVEPILAELDSIRAVAQGTAGELAGGVRITAPVAFGQVVLAPLLVEFAGVHPHIALTVTLTDEQVDLVAERIDVALRLGKLSSSTLIARRLGKLVHVACASPAYLRSRGAPRRPEELEGHDCLHFPRLGLRAAWRFRDHRGTETEVAVRGPIAINSGGVLRDAALAGLGITLVPRWNVQKELDEGTLVPLFPTYEASSSELDASVWLLLPSRRQVPVRVRAFTDFLAPRLRRHPSLTPPRGEGSRGPGANRRSTRRA